MVSSLQTTKRFWDASPCGGSDDFLQRKKRRYGIEPWIPALLQRIAHHKNIAEIGCGQGIDGLVLCSMMDTNGRYEGLDYSDKSVARANQSIQMVDTLKVQPIFRQGNAENLDIKDNSVECVYSLGVLHHTANEKKAFSEIYRILQPKGKAHIFLYRKWSPKVSVAQFLRLLQKIFDTLLGTNQCFYKWILNKHMEKYVGTMLLECFGVPYMKWYSKKEMLELFSQFKVVDLYPIGYNIPWSNPKGDGKTMFGYFWAIELEKS